MPRRAFTIAVTVAFILHLPLLPSNLGEWLQRMLQSHVSDYDDHDASAIIPIDLDLMNEEPSTTAAGTPPPPTDTPPPAATAPIADGVTTADAGPLAAQPVDGGIADAGADAGAPRKKRPPSDAGIADDAGIVEDAGTPSVRDPIAAAGGAGKISSKDPNVQVLIAGNVIRKHQLGEAFGRILVLIPEWRQFFADSPINPIRDLNHLLITAPRFRGDTSKIVAVMDFNVPEAKIKDAVDLIVNNVNGAWLDDTPVPTARVKIAGGDRLFAMVPGKRLLVVLPFSAKDQLDGLKKSKGFPNSKVGIAISMVTPSRPFKDAFPFPDSLKWLRAAVTPTSDGGADVDFETGDSSEAEARTHAPELTKAFDQIRSRSAFGFTVSFVGPAEFVAEGKSIKAHLPRERRGAQVHRRSGGESADRAAGSHGSGGVGGGQRGAEGARPARMPSRRRRRWRRTRSSRTERPPPRSHGALGQDGDPEAFVPRGLALPSRSPGLAVAPGIATHGDFSTIARVKSAGKRALARLFRR